MMTNKNHVWIASLLLAFATSLTTVHAAEKVDPSGTWKWESKIGENNVKFSLMLKVKDEKVTGTFSAGDRKSEIKSGSLKGDQLSILVERQYNDRQLKIDFHGKVTQNTIKGKVSVAAGNEPREFDWEAKRAIGPSDVVGSWQFRIEAGDRVLEPSLKLAKKGEQLVGRYTSSLGEIDAKNVNLKDGRLTFELSGENDGNKWKVSYNGKPLGNSIKGKVDYDFGGNAGTVDFEGKRVGTKKFKRKVLKKEKDEAKKD